MKDYWKGRAEQYNKLEWVNGEDYLDAIFESGNFETHHSVLDIGTGTGIIAKRIAPHVKEVFAVDNSEDMARQSKWKDNIYFIPKDIREPFFTEGIFDRITARMVFHHILEDRDVAMGRCYHSLKKGGLMVLSENVPPTPDCYDEFKQIFELKEKRIVFTEDELLELFAVFTTVDLLYYMDRNFSVRNWLDNNNLDKKIKDKIFDLHINGSDEFKEGYNMKITQDDCLIDIKDVILVGKK